MTLKKNLFVAKAAVIMGAIPFLIWAHEYGPDPGHSGVPNESGTCNQSQCHVGPPAVNGGSGSVRVSFPNGRIYTPGVKQHLVVTITDSAQKAWGFQLTARPTNSTSTMSGTLASTDPNTTILCASQDLNNQLETPYLAGNTQTCPATLPLQYIEQSLAGYNAGRGKAGSQTYGFDWTPPDNASADIVIYVAGNAANGDLQPTGDHIYTASYTLALAAPSGPPKITPNGVLSAGAFGGFSSVAPGSWMEIYGANLAPATRGWDGFDFVGNQAPTVLDGVRVTIGGQAAFVDYVSPLQVNAQVPSNTPTGVQQMTLTTAAGSSDFSITVNPLQPGLLAPFNFVLGNKQYAFAQFPPSTKGLPDGSLALPPNAIPGLSSRQAKPGEVLILYGVGFGPVLDAGNQDIPAGILVTAGNRLSNSFSLSFGGTEAQLQYFGLAPGFTGLYQFNVVVPNVPNNDLVPLTFKLNGTSGTQTLFIPVHN